MAKPIKNRIVTGQACLNYVNNAIGLVSCGEYSLSTPNTYKIGLDTLEDFFTTGEMAGQFVSPSTYSSTLGYNRNIEFLRFHHNNRVVGLILGDNDDGSYKIAMLGTDSIKWGYGDEDTIDGSHIQYTIGTNNVDIDNNDKYDFAGIITYQDSTPAEPYAQAQIRDHNFETSVNEFVPFDEAVDFKLRFRKRNSQNSTFNTFMSTGEYQGTNIYDTAQINNNLHLSSNKNNTLILGKPISEIIPNLAYNSHCFMYDTYNSIFDAWEGNWYEMLTNIYSLILMQSGEKPAVVISEGNRTNLYTRADASASPKLAGYEGKTHAFNFTPFNLILTRSESQALAYLENGTLPSDAFLYPLDWQNLPRTDGTPSTQDEDPSGTPPSGEDGDSGIDGTPTTDADPQITSNMLTNNNLYWLQAGQLESFITWFWQNAGEIIELDDLWDRIKGLYNDLASAIINIRYFPVDPYYIGGVSDTTNIVLSSIEMPITGIKKLNKTKLRKRTLGEITIPNKYNAFTDYSPYTSLMLYLPFHGWIDLDIDIFTGNKLQVRCIYDHISGTIQYGVYVISKGKEFLLNTVIAKMAVDIPITLQSKNDRDSAIFNNVTNAFGNLLGAGASAVSGNPIGLVMSTAGVASSGTQSAPLKVNGTVGETGAFFMPNKCAVYIKRPSYNRPKNYGARVGYPSNQGGRLSEFTGYTTVYNPQITFSGNTNADNVTIKPLQSEIDEIYTALEKGVIL